MSTTKSNDPTQPSRLWSRLGGLGLVYAILMAVAATVLLGNEPGSGASAIKLVTYYNSHKTSIMAGVFVAAFACLAFAFFLGALRQTLLTSSQDTDVLPTIATMGGAIYITGLLLMAALSVALIDAAHYRDLTAMQAVNVISNDLWVPVVVGLSILALSCGAAALATRSLPAGWPG